MLDFFSKLIEGEKAAPADDGEKLRLAATALLFRALFVDGDADPDEENQIRRIVHDEFGLDDDSVEKLMAEARSSAETAADLYGWTRLVNAEYEPEDKIHLMELLWRVVLADGVVDDHEHALMRRLAGLIHVPDPDSARARARAREALPRS
ncbi:MAG: Uncharacterised protein [SAR116 cluster bacterium MED-G04]|jgi:uncharacterized tellurite resistance protein B-like protein|nr:MAG: Uncharacterised protein [SAR116 cluster bacterium MED-G04]